MHDRSVLAGPGNLSLAGVTVELSNGYLSGVRNLTLAGGASLVLHRNGRTVGAASLGVYVFRSLELRGNSTVEFKQGGTTSLRGIVLRVGSLSIGRLASVHSDGNGEGLGRWVTVRVVMVVTMMIVMAVVVVVMMMTIMIMR
jgi:hypothetical protein